MSDLVHWRERACGESDVHPPHAYWDGDSYICRGVTNWQHAALEMRRLADAINAALLPVMRRAADSLAAFAKHFPPPKREPLWRRLLHRAGYNPRRG